MNPETEKEIYERIDAVYAGLSDQLKEEFLSLLWDASHRDIVSILRRWTTNRK